MLLVSIFKYLFLLLVFIFNTHFTFVLWIEGMQGGKVRAFPQEPGWAPRLLVRVVLAPDLAKHSDWDDTWGGYLLGELRYQTSFLFTQLKYIFFLEEYSSFFLRNSQACVSVSCGFWGSLSQCFSGSALFTNGFDVEIATDPNGSKLDPFDAEPHRGSLCGAQALPCLYSQAPVSMKPISHAQLTAGSISQPP